MTMPGVLFHAPRLAVRPAIVATIRRQGTGMSQGRAGRED